jgi:Bacterial protein of unknown function (DUF853)
MTGRHDDADPRIPQAGQQEPLAAYDTQRRRGGNQRQTVTETAIKAFIRSIAGSLGRAIMRAILGGRR